MAHTEIETEAVAVIEPEAPPAEKPEKPKRAPRKKAAPVEAAPAPEAEPVSEPETASEVAPEPPVAVAAEPEPSRDNGNPPAKPAPMETLDIRMLKELKLPDLNKLAKDHGIENASGMQIGRAHV